MQSEELQNIVNEIIRIEKLDISSFAAETGVNRSNLSTLLNDKKGINVSPKTLKKIKARFPGYFPITDTKTNRTNNDVILDRLSRAIADQAQANLKHADNYGAITLLIGALKEEMAREKTQARMEISLNRTFAGVATLSKDQQDAMKEIRDLFSQSTARKKVPSRGVGKRGDRIDGGSEKKGKSSA